MHEAARRAIAGQPTSAGWGLTDAAVSNFFVGNLSLIQQNDQVTTLMKKAAILFVTLMGAFSLQAQDAQSSLSQFFEGKQVVVKIDMPGSQQGIDIYPQKDNCSTPKTMASA